MAKVVVRLFGAFFVFWLLTGAAVLVPVLFLSDPQSDQSPLVFDAQAGEVWKVGIRASRPVRDAAETLEASGFAVYLRGTVVDSDSLGDAMTEYEEDSAFYFVEFVPPESGSVEVRAVGLPPGSMLMATDGKFGWFVFWFVCGFVAALLGTASALALAVVILWSWYKAWSANS